jgi:hypothetical protein
MKALRSINILNDLYTARTLTFVFIITSLLAAGIYFLSFQNTSGEIDEAIELAHNYLNEQISADGKFIYRRHIDHNIQLLPDYNIPRHLGSIYSLVMMDDYRPGSMDEIKVASSIRFIKENTFEKIDANRVAIWTPARLTANEEGGDIMKLGSVGLALISLAPLVDRFPDIISRDLLKQIGNSIIYFQKPDGEFHSIMYRDGSFGKGWKSLFYPGQAIFGLFELFRITEEKKYLDAAIKSLIYLESSRRNLSSEDMPADHWSLIASAKILGYGDVDNEIKQRILSHAEKVVRSIISLQIKQSRYESLIGGFSLKGEITSTTVKVEGLSAIYPFLSDRELKRQTKSCMELAIDFILRSQIREAPFDGAWARAMTRYDSGQNAMDRSGDRAESFIERKRREHNKAAGEVRIDYVQHALSALIGYQQLFNKK